jgi:NAD(P)H-dependent flavin oxidoreductase YrpB (nitropropane dioxygenase family)
MRTPICERLGLEYPIFAFTHCRDVVAAVSQAGGLGVLGAVGFDAEQLAQELDWIDAHVGDKPYAVDMVIPQKYEGLGEMDPAKLEAQLKAMIPPEHLEFADRLLAEHGVPEWPEKDEARLLGWTQATAAPLVEESLRHENVVMIANALGTPPKDVIEQVHAEGRIVGALCGKVKQALQHQEAGVDVVIAQGHEAGGHTGEISSLVLWPQVVDAVAPTPVLAAGGIGNGRQMAAALATGAQGVWTGSLWVAVAEAEAEPAEKKAYFEATSEDTTRTRSWTGKPARFLRNDWTNAWARDDTPDPLGMPLQGLVTLDAIRRTKRYAGVADAQKVAFNPVGQVVGQINGERTCREVIFDLVTEYVDTMERLNALLPGQ